MYIRPNETFEDLSGEWNLVYSNEVDFLSFKTIEQIKSSGFPTIPADVPGNFELSLYKAGLIPDPYIGLNILKVQKFENYDIWYFRQFHAKLPGDNDAVLVLDGVDCYADIFLNGTLVGTCDNMLIKHQFPIKNLLNDENEIVVHIKSTIKQAQKYSYPPFVYAKSINYESLYVRKAPHMFGWDITPRVLSAGIWRDVRVEYPAKERLREIYIQTKEISEDRQSATLRLTFNSHILEINNKYWEICIQGVCGEHQFEERKRIYFSAGSLLIEVDQPALWWSKGRGNPNLYHVSVRLECDGKLVDELKTTLGIRTIRLDRKNLPGQKKESEFCFYLNEERIFIKGTNWVPVDIFHSKDRGRLKKIFPLLDDIGCNMVRCWGGNVYEDDLFFDLCDQHGIMVWQDFTMACAVYPQDEDFQKRLETEARKIIKHLRQHPSLVLWAGDNECDETLYIENKTNPNENILTRKLLPEVIRQEDPARPYLPSSPYIDQASYEFGGRLLVEEHLWGKRDYFKSSYYKNAFCHFASEIGYHGCPSVDSIEKFISKPKLWPYQENSEWELHSTEPVPGSGLYSYRVDLMGKQIAELFKVIPDNLEEFSFASQVTQAEALKFFIEVFRYNKWDKTGIIWWNLIDGWPQFSDSVVDYYFHKKMAFEYIKISQQDICLMIKEPENSNQDLVVVNDSIEKVDLSYTVIDIDTGNIEIAGKGIAIADAVTKLGEIKSIRDSQKFLLINWEINGKQYSNHFLTGNPPFDLYQYRNWVKLKQNFIS